MGEVFKVKDLPSDSRPREKLLVRGPQSLTNSELIAILLRTGLKGHSVLRVAEELLQKFGSIASLASSSVSKLTTVDGIGNDKAATLMAAFELSRRIDFDKKWLSNQKITSPADVAELFIPIFRDLNKEHFMVVCLSTGNKIIRYETISIGSLNSNVVHPREVFKVAIENNSANIILIHNHPSGNLEPSNEDIRLTNRLKEAGKMLDINVFDHIIIGGSNFRSFVDARIL